MAYQWCLRICFWDDDDAIHGDATFRDILYDDIFRIIEEAGGPVTATDMAAALRNGRMANYSSQNDQDHRWVISKGEYIEDIAKDLGFIVERPKHRRTGNPLSAGWAISV